MPLPDTRMGLRAVEPLIVDDSVQSLEMMSALMMGFGVTRSTKVTTAAEAKTAMTRTTFDVILMDSELPGQDGVSLVRHVRGDREGPNFSAPIIMLSVDTARPKVERARDAGANFVIAKPVSATVLLERLLWIAQSRRLFVDAESYRGPDRRFQTLPLPDGVTERRESDLRLAATPERALSQDEIDGLFL